MSHWIVSSKDNVQAGEADGVLRPKLPTQFGTKRGVLYVHGHEALNPAAWQWQLPIERATLVSRIVAAGHVVVTADLGGNSTWGNDTVIARITAAKTYLLSLGVSPTKIALVGQSMGAQNAFVWAAANPSLVSCIVAMIPVIDVNDMQVNNRGGLGSDISSAYLGGWSEVVYGAAHNPATIAAAGGLDSIPIQMWYGTSDSLCLPALAETFAGQADLCEAHPISGGHAESTIGNVDIDEMLAFITTAG
jgi:predicted esterase